MKEKETSDKELVVCTSGSERVVCLKKTSSGKLVRLFMEPHTLILQEQLMNSSTPKKRQIGSIKSLEPSLITQITCDQNLDDKEVASLKHDEFDDYFIENHEAEGKPKLHLVELTHYILKQTPYYEKSCLQATKESFNEKSLLKVPSTTTTPMKKKIVNAHIEGIRFSGKEDDTMRDDIDEVIQSRTNKTDAENGFSSREGQYVMELQDKHVSKKYMKEHHQRGIVNVNTHIAIVCRKGEMCKIVFQKSTSPSKRFLFANPDTPPLHFGWIYHRFTSKLSEKNGEAEVPKLEQIKRAKDGTPVLILPSYQTIGVFYSCFPTRNGTPRQGSVAPLARGRLHITIPNGVAALDGLDAYSHVWLMFVFHRNRASKKSIQTKIRPPRLNGKKVGVFATRTPHRPNPIGLTCAKIDRIDKNMVYLSGIDLINETPIIDIKPYVPYSDCISSASTPSWVNNDAQLQSHRFDISFSDSVLSSLPLLLPFCEFYRSTVDLKQAIHDVIQTDPRPVYMKKKQSDKLYGFRLDCLNIRCRFVDSSVHVVDIEKWN